MGWSWQNEGKMKRRPIRAISGRVAGIEKKKSQKNKKRRDEGKNVVLERTCIRTYHIRRHIMKEWTRRRINLVNEDSKCKDTIVKNAYMKELAHTLVLTGSPFHDRVQDTSSFFQPVCYVDFGWEKNKPTRNGRRRQKYYSNPCNDEIGKDDLFFSSASRKRICAYFILLIFLYLF